MRRIMRKSKVIVMSHAGHEEAELEEFERKLGLVDDADRIRPQPAQDKAAGQLRIGPA